MDRDKKLTDSILRRHYGFIMTASWKKTDPDHFRGDFNDGTNCELKTGKYLRELTVIFPVRLLGNFSAICS